MTDFIRDDNGDYHIANGSDTFVRDPNGDFHLEPNASDFVNDGTSTLNAKSINSDSGKIKSDGSGNLTVDGYLTLNGVLTEGGPYNPIISITGESHFANGTFTDPDTGVARDAKFGGAGIAVRGGIKTDTLNVTSKVTIDPDALPTTDPKVKGQIWNNGGALYISLG